jgi:autotransporter translocation and assembly factor TamB
VALLLIAGVIGAAAFYGYRRLRALYDNLGPILVQQLRQQLGREVAIRHVDASHPGHLVLEGIAIARQKRLSEGQLARVQRIDVYYNFWRLVRSWGDPVGSVSEIVVAAPWLFLERDREGRLNIQDLFRPRPGAKPTTFRGRIILHNGAVTFQDYHARLPQLPAVNRAAGVAGWVDFVTFPQMNLGLAGHVVGPRAGPFRASGYIDSQHGRWLITAHATDADAAYWSAYFVQSPAARVTAGRADASLSAWQERAAPVVGPAVPVPIQYSALLAGRGLVIQSPRLAAPIRDASGTAQIDPTGVSLRGEARLAGMPITLQGRVIGLAAPAAPSAAPGTAPTLSLQVSAPSVTLPALRRLLPQLAVPRGVADVAPAAVEATVTGPASDFSAFGTLRLASLRAAGRPVRDVSLGWRYHAGVVNLTDARAAGVASLQAQGWLDLRARPIQLYVSGTAEGIALAQWVNTPRLKLDGLGRGRFAFFGPPDSLSGQAAFEVSPLQVNRASYDRAVGRVRLRRGLIEVRALSIVDPAGTGLVSGTIQPGGKLALGVRASGLQIEPLLAPYTKTPPRGTAFFWGQIGGTTTQPRLTGNLQLYGGRFGAYRVDYVEGEINATPQAISTERLVARLYPASIALRGTVRDLRAPSPALDMVADVDELSVGQALLALHRQAPVSGMIQAQLRIGGTIAQPAASGSVHVADVVARGYELGALDAQVRLTKERFEVTQLSGGTQGLTIEGSGSVILAAAASAPEPLHSLAPPPPPSALLGALPPLSVASGDPGTAAGTRRLGQRPSYPIQASLTLRHLDLALFNAEVAPYGTLGGGLDELTVSATGTLASPVARAELRANGITLNGEPLSGLHAALEWSDGRATVQDAELRMAEGAIRVPSATWQRPERPAAGGPARQQLTARVRLDRLSLARLLNVMRNSAYLGTPRGQSLLAALSKIPTSLQGTLNADVDVVPGGTQPRVVASVAIPDLTLPTVLVERDEEATPAASPITPAATPAQEPLVLAATGRATYEAGLMDLTALEISRGNSALRAQGTVLMPGAADRQTGRPVPDGNLHLQVDALSLPLRAVATFVPALYPMAGVGDVHVDAEGSLRAPRIRASADVDNPMIAGLPFTKLSFPLLSVSNGEVLIEGARLARVHPDGVHQVTLEGTLPFQWQPLGIPATRPRNLQVRLEPQELDILNDLAKLENPHSPLARVAQALGRLKQIRGKMEASVTLAGTAEKPQDSGDFRLSGVGFGLPNTQSQFKNINVHLAFRGDQVTVEQFAGESSSGGTFTVGGRINLGLRGRAAGAGGGPLDLALYLRDFKFIERNLSQYLNERIESTMRTVDRNRPAEIAPLRITGDFRTPAITGAIAVRDTTLGLPATFPEPPRERTPPIVNPSFDLVLVIGQNTHIRNPAIDAQVNGRLPITGTLAEPQVRGRLLVDRGTLTFPTARFRISGEIEVSYVPSLGAEAPAPMRVDLTATTRMTGRDPSTGGTQRYDITLTAQGPLAPITSTQTAGNFGSTADLSSRRVGGLTIQATSDPPLSQSQILAMIGNVQVVEGILAGGSNVQDVLRQEFEQALTASVVPALFQPFESRIEQALGLEEFGLDFAFREPVQLRIGRRLFDGFYGSYARALGATQEQSRLDLYYKISDRLRIGYRLEEPYANRSIFLSGTHRF